MRIEERFECCCDQGVGSVSQLVGRVSDFILACVRTRRDLAAFAEQGGGFKESQAWAAMIRELTAWGKDRCHPTSASKDKYKPTWPFVAFGARAAGRAAAGAPKAQPIRCRGGKRNS